MERTAGVAARAARTAWSIALARPWVWLTVWSALLLVAQASTDGHWLGSWFYVVRGVRALLGPDPFGLYAAHPELQMGPLTFVVSTPFVLLPPRAGLLAAVIAMQGAGLVALRAVRGTLAPGDATGTRRWFVGALLTMIPWTLLAARFGHMDDVLALVAGTVALRALRSGAVIRAALLIGLAVDCKPWIAPLALVLLAADRRRLLPAAALLVGVVATVWAPFVLTPGWDRATAFTIAVDPAATIHLLGLAGTRTPAWCRPAQLLLGAAAVALAARRGRPEAALLLVVVTRLLLDPSTHLYYAAGAALGACLLDTTALVPAGILIAMVGLAIVPYGYPAASIPDGVVRLVALALLAGLALGGPRREPPLPRRGSDPPRRPGRSPAAAT